MPNSDHASTSSVTDFALLGQLFEDHRPRLLAMLRRRIDPRLAVRIDPEEVLNDAFFDASRKWGEFREQNGLSAYAWLYRIAFDRLVETYRTHARGRRDLRRDLPWPEESSVMMGLSLVNAATSPSDAAARAELQERMQQAMGLLKDKDRDVLSMRYYEQFTFGEIGQVLGITENAATLRYTRALGKLEKCWLLLQHEKS